MPIPVPLGRENEPRAGPLQLQSRSDDRREMSIGRRLIGFAMMMLLGASSAWAAPSGVSPRAIQDFVLAAMRGDELVVRRALDAGMPVDVTLEPKDTRYPYTERTALEAASTGVKLEVVRLLLSRGATLRRDDRHGIYAASMHSGDAPELLEILVDHHAASGSDLNADFGPALIRAAANGARGEVRYLLVAGLDPDWRSTSEPWNDPAIVRAVYDFEVIDMLIAAGADPMGGALSYSWSPLFPAVQSLNVERTRLYLEMGIDPHVRGERGNVLSMAACNAARTARPPQEHMRRSNQIVEFLLRAGVDPNLSDAGRSPLRCAEDSHNDELAAMLEAAGGRSHDSLWNRIKRGATTAAFSVVLLFGGGM